MFERLGIRFGVVAAGVDVFFVISGFIVLPGLTTRPMPEGAFLWNRAVTLLLVLLPGGFCQGCSHMRNAGGQWLGGRRLSPSCRVR